jgi:GH43 family beta-xylosidase
MKCIFIAAFFVVWSQIEANTFTNPIALNSPDPWMQYYNGYYYLVATTFSNHIYMRKSKTVSGIHSAANVLVYTLNNTGNMWAPEFHFLNNKWYLYYAAAKDVKNISSQRIHVLESEGTDPLGPYHFKADLDSSPDGHYEIDPSVITIDGKLYLIGSYSASGSSHLFIRPMANPYTPSGNRVLLSKPTTTWEATGNEGPEPLQHGGKNMIIYSANYCGTADYQLGLLTLTGSDPLNIDHWHKSGPVFRQLDSAHVYGPGHNGFFKSPDGKEDWIVYHANNSTAVHCDGIRSARAQKFTWNEDGTPNFGLPVATGVQLQSPSGEQ